MKKLFNTLFLLTISICNDIGHSNELLELSQLHSNTNNGILCEKVNQNKYTNQKNNEIIKILSCDGGGTRGYIQSKFLELFCNDAEINDISEYFDLIAGTSIGGINAVAFASGMKPIDSIKFFREKSPWIFTIRNKKDIFSKNASIPSHKPNKLQMLYMMGISNPFYKAVSQKSNYGNIRLRNEIASIFGDKLLSSIKKPILLTAHNYSEYTPIVFTNTEIKPVPGTFKDIKIVDALMATSSCPIYFPSTQLKLVSDPNEPAYHIMDGALFQNNPSSLAFSMAKMLYPSAKKYNILSIGTGIGQIGLHINTKEKEPSNMAFMQYNNFLDITMQNSQIDNDILFKGLSSNENSDISYYRFNIKLDSNRDCSFDNSTKDFFDYLDIAVEEKYKEDSNEIKKFINKLKNISK